MGWFSFGSDTISESKNLTSTNTSTDLAVDSYNNTFNRVNNLSLNVGDLTKTLPGLDSGAGAVTPLLQKGALGLAGVILLLFLFKPNR